MLNHRRLSRPAPPPSALSLLEDAKRELDDATWQRDPPYRFAGAYLAALRAGAAVLAARGRPHRGRSRPVSVWTLLGTIAPELGEWAAFFDANSATRAAVQAGITRGVSTRAADDLVRQSTQFLAIARRAVHGGG
ncbi:MAG: hypothetical protein GEU98_12320 [Pseudonocardiaceae bacterium]|nr:hypothetical protein [Pseudonocardiaceae bacterium]